MQNYVTLRPLNLNPTSHIPPSHNNKNRVSDVFDALSYGPAPESAATAYSWLDAHGREFGHFINNKVLHPTHTPFSLDSRHSIAPIPKSSG